VRRILFPSSMKKASILIHQNYLDETIKTLHEEGIMQILEITREEAEERYKLFPSTVHPETMLCTDYEQRLKTLIKILKRQQKKQTGIKALLNPTLPEIQDIDDVNTDELYSDIESFLTEHEKIILKDHHRHEQITERISNIDNTIEQITPFTSFDFTLKEVGTSPALVIHIGITDRLPALKQACQPIEQSVLYNKQITKGKKPEWAVVNVAHISQKKTIERIIAEYITIIDVPQMNATPSQAIKTLKQERKTLQEQQKEIEKTLGTYGNNHLNALQSLHEQITLERIRKEINGSFAQTQSTILITGWVLSDDCNRLTAHIEDATKHHALINYTDPSANPDNPPTHFKTPWWAQSFKTLLTLFAVPKYNEINPTVIMGIFFVLFFGMMLGDAGYGIIIIVLSLFGYLKMGKFSPMIKEWSFMGIWLGLVTTIVGFLTYSIFGNLVHMIMLNESSTELLYQFSLMGIQFPIESLNDPIAILTMALILGIIHLNIGIILGIYQAYKRKQYKEMFTEKLCWIPLQIGGGLLIGYFILNWSVPEPMFTIAGILVIIGIIQLLYASGPVGFFDITGYVGDWLSYARLLALGLATAGMALAFNVVSKLLGEMIPFVGIIITILLLLILHVVNLAISALGAGVHSLRLQYVEFFNRFYEGGGHEFTPFKIKRTYTQIKKDKNS